VNVLLLLRQQPNGDRLPDLKPEFPDSRKLRQYTESSAERPKPTYPVNNIRVSPKATEDFKKPNVPPKEDAPAPNVALKEEPPEPAPEKPKTTPAKVVKPVVKAFTPKPANPTKMPEPKVFGTAPKNTLPPLATGSYITPNEILQRTAIAIKTFNRAQCLLMTVASFKQNYPDIPIFVADDSFEDEVSANLTAEYGVTYIRLAVDSGVSYGRNKLIDHLYKLGKLKAV